VWGHSHPLSKLNHFFYEMSRAKNFIGLITALQYNIEYFSEDNIMEGTASQVVEIAHKTLL